MDGDYYLKKLSEIHLQLSEIIQEIAQDEYEKEQWFKFVPRSERIIQFPTANLPKEENKDKKFLGFLEFTEKEFRKMPRQFKKHFKTNKIKANIRKRNDGRYEIRCQIEYKKITASSKNLETAKEKFIKALAAAYAQNKKNETQTAIKENVKLGTYIYAWLDTVKKPYIKQNTYQFYTNTIKHDIIPQFGNLEIDSISALDIQTFLNKIIAQGKNRTAKKIIQILKPMFEYAEADDVIKRSPMNKVKIGNYEQKHGTALTRSEEKILFDSIFDDPSIFNQAYLFILYTGLRRSELATATLSDKWVTVITGKQRKGKKEKSRRIPISPMLKMVLPFIDFNEITQISNNMLTRKIKEILPNHHLHDLRHTFITRCQECGIKREIVSLWAGHAADSSITSTVYTHLEQNEELQLKEIDKFIYDFK